jgi:KUP system potassium uptake protein
MVQKSKSKSKSVVGLSLAAIGVVFGDIGTSPLYTLRECFNPKHGIALTEANVFGILSMVFWALTLVVAIKYALVVMRADNKGQGGDLALLALAMRREKAHPGLIRVLIVLGIFGTALFYGDGMITPAISVLGAMEGLAVGDGALAQYVLPLTIIVLLGLFAVQSRGTGKVGKLFGPITLVWFIVLAVLGIHNILHAPAVLGALSPHHALLFFFAHPLLAFLALGAVVLAITGAEALYADMGHFGRLPIRLGWYTVVWPALMLNYLGQGALLLVQPGARVNPFYMMAPDWFHIPLVVLATAAAVIASQALISGAFSITSQAIQLGFCPRMTVLQTSEKEYGQIYIPAVNWGLFAAVMVLVVSFRSSEAMASAYGIAVTAEMIITSILAFVVLRNERNIWLRRVFVAALLFFLVSDIALFSANALKMLDGGWVPMLIAGMLFYVMMSWDAGRRLLNKKLHEGEMPLGLFIQSIESAPPIKVDGAAVFMTSSSSTVPHALLHNLKHNKVLHERVLFLTIASSNVPYTDRETRLEIRRLSPTFWQLVATYGFMEEPSVPELLAQAEPGLGFTVDPMNTSFFLSRETIVAARQPELSWLRRQLFSAMQKSAARPTDFFHIPPNRVVEMGTQVEM